MNNERCENQLVACFVVAKINSFFLSLFIFIEMDPEIRQLIGPTQIAYAGCLHAPIAERRNTFMQNCSEREQRHIPIVSLNKNRHLFLLDLCTIHYQVMTLNWPTS